MWAFWGNHTVKVEGNLRTFVTQKNLRAPAFFRRRRRILLMEWLHLTNS